MGYELLAGKPDRSYGGFVVRSIVASDMESIRQWRNAQLPILRQSFRISPEAQRDYFTQQVQPDFDCSVPCQVLLALRTSSGEPSALRAYGGLTNIDWHNHRAELSFLTAPKEAEYADLLFAFLYLVVKGVAFEDLGLHRIFHESYDVRPLHHNVLERFGFTLEGRLRDHVRVEGKWTDSLIFGLLREEG